MSLHGSLETFALPDVLTLVASTRKTGELRVSGPRLEGSVWLDSGQVVQTAVGKATTFVDAFFDLLRLREGKFSFEADRTAPHPGEAAQVEPLLEDAGKRLAQWREIERVIPSLDHVLELISDVPGPVTLRHDQWPLIVALAANRTPRAVLEAIGASEFDGCKALKELADAHLVKVSAPAPAPPKEERAPAPAGSGEADADRPGGPADRSGATIEARKEETPGVRVMEAALPPVGEPVGAAPSESAAMAAALVRQLATADGSPAQDKSQKQPATPAAAKGPGSKPSEGAAPANAGARPPAGRLVGTGAPAVPQRGQARPVQGAGGAEPQGTPAAGKDGASGPAAAAAKAAPADPSATKVDAAPDDDEAAAGPGEEPINRGLLLKFLSSVRS